MNVFLSSMHIRRGEFKLTKTYTEKNDTLDKLKQIIIK